uniref:Uncharacterized protein n=1 Tax=Trichuris muris TaxID=70415 RepID=A0A5S6QQ39_TRIMR
MLLHRVLSHAPYPCGKTLVVRVSLVVYEINNQSVSKQKQVRLQSYVHINNMDALGLYHHSNGVAQASNVLKDESVANLA